MIEPFFFANGLFGVWRDVPGAKRAWILAPPFAEEEKSARRTLTDIARFLQSHGEANLLFSFRGQGDSGGDFASLGLSEWREDFSNAINETKRRAPNAEIGLLGVRLGASLALEVAAQRDDIAEMVLLEPLLSGRSFLGQQLMRQKIRAQMTDNASAELGVRSAEFDDLDGWPIGAKMKSELQALDVMKPSFEIGCRTFLFQIGPKTEVAPNLRALGEKLNASVDVVVMPPFWNLLDYSDCAPLLKALDLFGV